MPIFRNRITQGTRTCVVEYFDEKFSVTYSPGAITPAKEAELAEARIAAKEAQEAGETPTDDLARNAEILAERLSEILVSWDVVEEDGTVVPTTLEELKTFPNALLMHVSIAIGEDMSPKQKRPRR